MQESQEMWVWSLGQKYLLQVEMTTHSSILAWKTPWTEEPGGLQFMVLQRVRHNSDKWAYNPGTKEIQIKNKEMIWVEVFQKNIQMVNRCVKRHTTMLFIMELQVKTEWNIIYSCYNGDCQKYWS